MIFIYWAKNICTIKRKQKVYQMPVKRLVNTEITTSLHPSAGQNQNLMTANKVLQICDKVKIFHNDSNKTKLHSQRN
jgi:hypothetical protein